MSAIYMSQLSTTLPLMEGDHHHQEHLHQGHFQAFTLPKGPPILFPFVISSSSSNPSDSSSTLIYGGGGSSVSDHHSRQQQRQAMLEPQHVIGGSSGVFATPFPTVESIRDDMIERSSYDPYDIGSSSSASARGAGKWSTGGAAAAAAKMRITRKASDPGAGAAAKKPRRRAQQQAAYEDHGQYGGMNQGGLGVIRVCSDCNTTKTPLWRSGPSGPKSLCNACGIRQRKARRAMMASGGGGASVDGSGKAAAQRQSDGKAAAAHAKAPAKEKRADVDRSLPFKKRCKVAAKADHAAGAAAGAAEDVGKATARPAAAAVPTRDLVDSIGVNWGKSPATGAGACSFRPPPAPFAPAQDEITDAAMLLMTLSCGLVRS